MYRNGSSILFASPKLDWERQIVLITGGEPLHSLITTLPGSDSIGGTGIGALLAETLTMRNVTVVVLSKDPVKVDTDNGKSSPPLDQGHELTMVDDIVDSLFTYICDVSNCKEVEAISQRVIKEVRPLLDKISQSFGTNHESDRRTNCDRQQRRCRQGKTPPGPD